MSGRSGYGYHSSGINDYGESFIETQRQQRFRKLATGPPSRARSEVAEVLAYGNGPAAHSAWRHRRENSYQDSMQTSLIERPRSSFEPAASSRVLRSRADDWYEVEQKVNEYSSEEELEEDFGSDDDSRDELARYHFKPQRGASQQNNQTYTGGHSYLSVPPMPTQRRTHQEPPRVLSRGGGYGFDPNEVYYFGVIHLSPEKVQKILTTHPPPYEYRDLTPIERAAYLFYFTLYRKYFQPIKVFHRVFNREFYKYTCEGDSEDMALWKICKHTQDEYKQRVLKRNQAAYDLSQKHLFSDERGTPDSRASDPSRVEHDSDIVSVDSISKEPHKFRVPHAFLHFSVGGRVLYVNPESSVSTIRMDDMKVFVKDRTIRRNIEALESFKGPLRFGETQTQTPLLFIQRQIDRILHSDVYRANPASSDANDCLLIWRLLEMLVRQHGRVTGPDLAHLLTRDYSYSSTPASARGRPDTTLIPQNQELSGSTTNLFRDERYVNPSAVDKYTQFLLLGLVDEAIDCAMNDGLFFDALMLAHRMFKNDSRKLEEYEAKLLARRPQQHPTMTLIHVAAQTKVPILNNTSADDASGWRGHIAIVLANLATDAAIDTVYQLGLELARKEFNSAADFCFLAVNLLKPDFDAFRAPILPGDETNYRRHIKLISASLPDDEFHSTMTRFGWSITDFQATEIYDFALKLANNGNPTKLSGSVDFQKCRVQYAQLLAEYGGFNKNAYDYCDEVARAIWAVQTLVYEMDVMTSTELCDMAERLKFLALPNGEDPWFIAHLRPIIDQITQNQAANQQHTQQEVPVPTAQPQQASQPSIVPVTEVSETLAPSFAPGATSTPNVTTSEAFAHHQQNKLVQHDQHRTQDVLTDYQHDKLTYNNAQNRQNNFASNHYQFQQEPISPIHSVSSHQPSDSETPSRASSMSPRESITTDPYEYHSSRRESISTPFYGHQNVQINDQPQNTFVQYQHAQHQNRGRLSSQRTLSESSNATLDGMMVQVNKQQTQEKTHQNSHDNQHVNQPRSPPAHELSPQRSQFDQRGRLDSSASKNDSRCDTYTSTLDSSSPKSLQTFQTHMTHSQSQPLIHQKVQQPLVDSTKQQPIDAHSVKQDTAQQQTQKNTGGGGFLSGITRKFVKLIPDSKEMKLPDDSNPTIRWDPALQKWVGDEVEEEYVPPPPPSMPAASAAIPVAQPMVNQPTQPSITNQLQSVANGQVSMPTAAPTGPVSNIMRRGASSRYRNVLEDSLGGAPAKNPMLENPLGVNEVPPLPPTFGFIPTPMDSGDTDASPFSPFSEGAAGSHVDQQQPTQQS